MAYVDYNEKDFPKIALTVTNLSELTKFKSKLVDIKCSSFDGWFTRKEESIEGSKSCVEKMFLWKYRLQTGKTISPGQIKNECKITKIYDKEFAQDDATLYYRYELRDTDDNPIFLEQYREHGYGSVYDSIYLITEDGNYLKVE